MVENIFWIQAIAFTTGGLILGLGVGIIVAYCLIKHFDSQDKIESEWVTC